MASQSELKKRLKVLMNRPENQVCSDCPERQPRWASLIVPPPGSPPGSLPMGAFCCLECSGSHRRLGVHISFVRSVNLDSWKEKEVLAMENGGNKKVNAIFEGRLPNAAYGPSPKPIAGASGPTREKYIRDKYERRKYFDEGAYQRYLQGSGGNDDDDDDDDDEEEEEEEEVRAPPRNSSRAPSDAAKLRAAKLQSRKAPVLAPTKAPAKPQAAAPPPPPAPAPAQAAFDLLDFSSAPDPDVGPPLTPEPSERPPVDMFNNMAISTTSAGTEVMPAQGNGVSAAGQANSNQGNSFGGSPQPKKMTSDDIMAMFNAPAARSQLGFPSFGGAAMNGGAPLNTSAQTNMMMGSLGGSTGPRPQGMMGAPLSGGSVGAGAQMMPMGTGSGPAGAQGLRAGMPGGGSAGGNPMMMVGGMYQQNVNQGMVGPSNMQVMMQQQQQPMMNSMNAGAGGVPGAGIGGQGNTQMMGGVPMMPQPVNGMGMQGAAGAGIGMNNFPMMGATNPSNNGAGNMMMGGMAPMGGNMMMGGGMGGTMGGGGMVMMMSPAAMNATPRGGLVNGGQQQQPQQVKPQTDRFASLAQF